MHLALRNQRHLAPALGIVLLLLASIVAPGQAPASPAPQPPATPAPQAQPPLPPAAQQPPAPALPLTAAQQLAADTARLQQLATELKAAMDKSTKDTLSLTVIKKAQEVEKLAHKVRDEMRASIASGS